MNKSVAHSTRVSQDYIPSISALDNNVSFDTNLHFRQN
jgi:hypothetical protein